MSDFSPDRESKPHRKRNDGPPKPPTKTAKGLQGDSGEPPHDPLMEMVWAVTHATATWSELMRLNGGGRPLKRESLELSLDRNVVLLGKLIPTLQDEDSEMVARIFREIRDYRRRHPRTGASNHEQAEQAQKVLDDIR